MCLAANNFFDGERWGYGLMMQKMVIEARIILLAWVYDINCRFKKAALDKATGLRNDDPTFFVPLFYPIPPFHALMHNFMCKVENHPSYMTGLGRLRGEPAEILNSKLAAFAPLSRYYSFLNRAVVLTMVLWRWNNYQLCSLPQRQVAAINKCMRVEVR